MRCGFGEFLADLIHIFLVTLLDLLAEELLEGAILQPLFALLRQIRDHIRYQGSRQTLRLLIRIVCEERVDYTARRRVSGRNRC